MSEPGRQLAAAEYLATMAAYRLALERLGCACRPASIEFRDGAYKCLRCVTLESHTAGADMLERLSELRDGAAWAYQLAGAIDMPVGVLDNLSALAQGEKPPHDWPYPADCERLRKAEADFATALNGAQQDAALERTKRFQAEEGLAISTAFCNDREQRITTLEATLSENEDQHSENWRVKAGHLEERVTELEAALEEARKSFCQIDRLAGYVSGECIERMMPEKP